MTMWPFKKSSKQPAPNIDPKYVDMTPTEMALEKLAEQIMESLKCCPEQWCDRDIKYSKWRHSGLAFSNGAVHITLTAYRCCTFHSGDMSEYYKGPLAGAIFNYIVTYREDAATLKFAKYERERLEAIQKSIKQARC